MKFQREKNNNRLRYNKKCWGGQIPPGSFRVNPASMAILYAINAIRQQSDYVTGVKDRWWASNRITLEFDWTVHDSGWRAV